MLFCGEMEMEPAVYAQLLLIFLRFLEHVTNIIQYITNCMMLCYEVFDHELFSMRKCPVEDG